MFQNGATQLENDSKMTKLVEISDFMERYKVSRSTTYRLFDSGALTLVKIG